MGQVTVTLNAKTYRLRCGDGEEQRLAELADHVGQRIEQLATQFGQFGDERLLLMAALLITDDMLEMKARLERSQVGAEDNPATPPDLAFPVQADAGQSVEAVSVTLVPAESPPPPEPQPERAPDRFDPLPATPSAPTPLPRRGSLEARLAQARVGTPPKPGA